MYKSEHLITAKHYLVFCTIVFSAGIFLFVRLNSYMTRVCILGLSAISAMFFILLILKLFKLINIRLKFILLPIFLSLFTILGILRVSIIENPSYNTLLSYANKEVWLYGQITSVPHLTTQGYSRTFEFKVEQVNQDPSAKGGVVMYIPHDRCTTIAQGDKLCCWTKLSVPTREDAENNFDYYTRLRGRNVFLIGNTRNANLIEYKTPFSILSSFREFGLKIRNCTANEIDKLFADDIQSAAILKGILLGDKSGFSDELYTRFSNAGISHIVAVSGLHLSILFSFLMIVLTGKRSSKRKFVLLLSIPVILIFTSVSAFSLSVCRAAIMLLISITAVIVSENYDPVSALFLALGVIISVSPYSLFSKSLLLSFSATLGIFTYYKYLNQLLTKLFPIEKMNQSLLRTLLLKIRGLLFSSFALTASSLIGTLFFSVLFFGKISKIQFLTNLWCIPLVSVIFCLGYICLFLSGICPGIVVKFIKPVLLFALKIIKSTVCTFGDDKHAIVLSEETIKSFDFYIYLGVAVFIYFVLKLCCDLVVEKNKRAVAK